MKLLWLWLLAVPLFCVLAVAESCSRPTAEDYPWWERRGDIYPNLERDPYAIPEVESSPFVEVLNDPDYGESEPPLPVEPPEPTEETHWKVYRVRARMTACSPQDPKDSGYYRRHGWKGASYNMCFDLTVIPKGSLVRIQPSENEYMNVSFPGKFWTVDASGGTVIRNKSTPRGVVHGDVKYRTLYSVRQFGNKYVIIEVILPAGFDPGWVFKRNVVEVYWLPKR